MMFSNDSGKAEFEESVCPCGKVAKVSVPVGKPKKVSVPVAKKVSVPVKAAIPAEESVCPCRKAVKVSVPGESGESVCPCRNEESVCPRELGKRRKCLSPGESGESVCPRELPLNQWHSDWDRHSHYLLNSCSLIKPRHSKSDVSAPHRFIRQRLAR